MLTHLPIGASEDEAPYVLDGLYGHESRFESEEHFVDTGGANDHVFGMFSPQIWEHINLTGIYDWTAKPQPDGVFRPLHTLGDGSRYAA